MRKLTKDELDSLIERVDQPNTDKYIVMTDATGVILGGESCSEPHEGYGAIIAASLPRDYAADSSLMVAIIKDGMLTEIRPY